MSVIPLFAKELELEALTTRKMLERIPADRFDWKPHPKSMSLIRLATHVAEIPSWIAMTIDQDDINFDSASYKPTVIADKPALMDYFESMLSTGRSALQRGNEEMLEKTWTMRDGDHIWVRAPKGEVLYMTFAQVIHHRAQLGVFLRMLDIPIPGSYGPSADEA
jgi:uncharacterized damage-inducible protein DinB